MPFSQYRLQELPFYDGFLKVRDNEGIAFHFVITQSVILPLEVCLCVCVCLSVCPCVVCVGTHLKDCTQSQHANVFHFVEELL